MSRINLMKIFRFEECPSTQAIAKRLAQQGESDLTTVVAKKQTEGVGRQGKAWISDEGGLWMSVVLKRRVPIDQVSYVALSVGIEAHKALNELCIETIIKYPNDIMAFDGQERKKLAGILCQSSIKPGSLEFIIVGLGINVTNEPPAEGTSLKRLTGKSFELNDVMKLMIGAIDKSTLRLENDDKDSIIKELFNIGCIQMPS